MRTALLIVVHVLAGFTYLEAQQTGARHERMPMPRSFVSFTLNSSLLLAELKSAPAFTLDLPDPSGVIRKFELKVNKTMDPGLASAFPEIKCFDGVQTDDPEVTAKFDLNEHGFHAMVFDGTERYFIEPVPDDARGEHICFYRKDYSRPFDFEEYAAGEIEQARSQKKVQSSLAGVCTGDSIYNYRAAIACTHKYAMAATSQSAPTLAQVLSKIVLTMNRVNGIFEKEAALRLVLVPTTTAVIFTDAASDPFSQNSSVMQLMIRSQQVIDSLVGDASYDLGHTFCTTGGGVAWLAGLCTAGSKGQGVSGSSLPIGDAYDVDYVCHEIGHQLGATHTFNAITGSCSGNRVAGTAVEPGSGITIMGYAGICGANNLSTHSIPFFHATSYDQLIANTRMGSGSSCPTREATGNRPPQVSFIQKYHVVPRGTPFMLEGSATDPDNDPLTYSWEEVTIGSAAANWNADQKPYFRSYSPGVTAVRYFPSEPVVRSGNYTGTRGEFLTSKPQKLAFRFTARDNRLGGGGVCSDSTVVELASTGPFSVTVPNGPQTVWPQKSLQAVKWEVNGTEGAPVYCGYVNIYCSLDGGLTYTLLAEAAANNGEAPVLLPAVEQTTATCRIKVSCAENIFYDISDQNFVITADTTVSIQENDLAQVFRIWPNPATDAVWYQTDLSQDHTLTLMDLTGRVLEQRCKAGVRTPAMIDLREYPAGLYMLEFRSGDKKLTRKLVRH